MRITIFGVKTVILQTNWNMKNEIVQINESEYKAILLQAVAVSKMPVSQLLCMWQLLRVTPIGTSENCSMREKLKVNMAVGS